VADVESSYICLRHYVLDAAHTLRDNLSTIYITRMRIEDRSLDSDAPFEGENKGPKSGLHQQFSGVNLFEIWILQAMCNGK